MTEPFAISTPDPNFDPRKPVTVNGYPFVPDCIPIDDTARDGRYQLVLCPKGGFALARWADGAWHMANGALDFEPTHYRPKT